MLYTSQAPILDLTGKDIKSMKDTEHAFHTLNLCPKENNKEKPNSREETGDHLLSCQLCGADASRFPPGGEGMHLMEP